MDRNCKASSEQQDIGKNALNYNATTRHIQKPCLLYSEITISNEQNLQHIQNINKYAS